MPDALYWAADAPPKCPLCDRYMLLVADHVDEDEFDWRCLTCRPIRLSDPEAVSD